MIPGSAPLILADFKPTLGSPYPTVLWKEHTDKQILQSLGSVNSISLTHWHSGQNYHGMTTVASC